jgi:hypothetical protein
MMNRVEIEKTVEPIIRECLCKFGDLTRPGTSFEELTRATIDTLRRDVRWVSLLVSLLQSTAGPEFGGEGLELGCGYGFLLFLWQFSIPGCAGLESTSGPEVLQSSRLSAGDSRLQVPACRGRLRARAPTFP